MARYEHLPIYKKAFDFAKYIDKIVRNFSRYNKYTYGTELRNLSREILKDIIRANNAKDKTSYLIDITRMNSHEIHLVVLKVSPEINWEF